MDSFGQYYDVLAAMQTAPVQDGLELAPDLGPPPQPGLALLEATASQPSRLRLRFLDALDDTKVVGLSSAASPVCGWLIPNLPDDSLMVYDAAGVLQGELLLAQSQAIWLPSPDLTPPGGQTAPPELTNPHLPRSSAACFTAASPAAALADLLATIEEGVLGHRPVRPRRGTARPR